MQIAVLGIDFGQEQLQHRRVGCRGNRRAAVEYALGARAPFRTRSAVAKCYALQ
jgi:hypothetical protein